MPIILRYRGFNIGFYVWDHGPAHVHVKGHGVECVFLLGCDGGQVEVRDVYGMKNSDQADIRRFIEREKATLCLAWEKLHGRDKA